MLVDFNNISKKNQKLILFGILISCIAGTYISIGLMFEKAHASPIWIPSGIGLAAVLIYGKRVLATVVTASLLSAIFTTSHLNIAFYQALTISMFNAVGTYVQVWGGYKLLKYLKSDKNFLDNVRSTFIFAIVALLAALLSAMIGVSIRWYFSVVDNNLFFRTLSKWWLGDALGILILASLILSIYKNRKMDISIARFFEVLSLFTLIFVFTQIIFGESIQNELKNSLPFLVIPILLWIAFRFSPRETTLAILIITTIAIIGTINDNGVFVREDVGVSLLVLQLCNHLKIRKNNLKPKMAV